jgi:hypothetical protein
MTAQLDMFVLMRRQPTLVSVQSWHLHGWA